MGPNQRTSPVMSAGGKDEGKVGGSSDSYIGKDSGLGEGSGTMKGGPQAAGMTNAKGPFGNANA